MSEQKFMTVKQAAEYLGTNRQKISTLIRRGVLTTLDNPMDTRQKLIPVEQVEKMKAFRLAALGEGIHKTGPNEWTAVLPD